MTVRAASAGAAGAGRFESRFLDPAVVARLDTLELRARTIVEGFLSGLHRSPYKGFSAEFAEYRQYLPGDDIARIDWKVFARSDRYYVKTCEEDTNLDCHLLLDVSASMQYASGGLSKLAYGSMLCASLAYLMSRQREGCGLTLFDDAIVSRLPASARPGHLRSLLVALDHAQAGKKTNVSRPLHQLADAISRRGMVVLVSDLLDDPAAVVEGLRHFRFRGTDVIVFHVLDPAERTFPFENATRFRDMENGDEITAVPGAVRRHYLDGLERTMAHYRRELGSSGIDYRVLDTSEPLDQALTAYLSTRSRTRA